MICGRFKTCRILSLYEVDALKKIYLGVVNHCKETNGKVHWHVFWDFDNCDVMDVVFAADRFVDDGYTVNIISSSPECYHLVVVDCLTKAQAKKLESWVCDTKDADYLGMDAEHIIPGATGATLRISPKNGYGVQLLAMVNKGSLDWVDRRICRGISQLYCSLTDTGNAPLERLFRREAVDAAPQIVIYESGVKRKIEC